MTQETIFRLFLLAITITGLQHLQATTAVERTEPGARFPGKTTAALW